MFEFLLPQKLRRKRKARTPRKDHAPEPLTLPLDSGGTLELLFQRDRCRTLRLSVKPDASVLLKAPAAVPLEDVLCFVRSRLDWIHEKQAFFLEHRGKRADLREGGSVLFLGKPFLLVLAPSRRGARPRLTGNRLELPCRSDAPADIEAAFKAWRMALARDILARRLHRLDLEARAVFGDEALVSGLIVRSLKRRWGSCSVRGQITLAAQLIELPLPLVDYVLCHELCHLRHMDHSPAFHAALRRLLPDAREREKDLRIWALEHPRS